MASRKDAQKTNKKNHENVRRSIRGIATPMIRYSRLFKDSMEKIPNQANTMSPYYTEILDRTNRVKRIRKADLVDVEDVPTASPSPAPGSTPPSTPGPGTIEILTPTQQAAQAGIPVNEEQRFHARIMPTDKQPLDTARVQWHSSIEGVLRGQPSVQTHMGAGISDAFFLFEFTKPGDHVVTVQAVSKSGEKLSAQVRVKVLPPGVQPSPTPPQPGTPDFTGSEIPITGAEAHFIQPTQMYLAKGLPLHKSITFVAELHSSDGKPFKAKNIRFTSDKDGVLGPTGVRVENGVSIAHVMHLFPTVGERRITVEAIDESGKKAFDTIVITINPRSLMGAPGEFTDQLKEGEAPFTVDKFVAQKLGPAIDTLTGIYDGALKHAHRDIRFLVKWKRKVVSDFKDVKSLQKDIHKDFRDGKIDKIKKYMKHLSSDLRVFERRIRLFNQAMNEQRKLNQFLLQTRDAIMSIRGAVQQLGNLPNIEPKHILQGDLEVVTRKLTMKYTAIRTRLQEMGRRVQRMDGGITSYKKDLAEMIAALSSSKAHDQIVDTFNDYFKNLEGTVQKELVEDINGMVELLRGVADDIAEAQQFVKKLGKIAKELKG